MRIKHKDLVERRASRRQWVVLGRATLIAGTTRLRCVLLERSAAGARVRASFPLNVSGPLSLVLGEDNPAIPCAIRWISGREIGVQFAAAMSEQGV
jgi:hypothetical protein